MGYWIPQLYLEGLAYLEIMHVNVASPLFASQGLRCPDRWEPGLPGDRASLPPQTPRHPLQTQEVGRPCFDYLWAAQCLASHLSWDCLGSSLILVPGEREQVESFGGDLRGQWILFLWQDSFRSKKICAWVLESECDKDESFVPDFCHVHACW